MLAPVQLYRYIGSHTAIKQTTIDDVYYADGIIHNSNRRHLEIYTVGGILLIAGDSDLNLSAFANGIYIVKSASGVLKIVK